jgi:membrane protease YdiL (CAAX protease family)
MLAVAILLILSLIPALYVLRKDPAEYRAFKTLTRTQDRLRRFRIWTLKSFLLYGASTLVVLALLRRFSALVSLPREFQPLSSFFITHGPSSSGLQGFFAGVACALVAGLVLGIVLARRKNSRNKNKGQAAKPVTLGDIAPLIPRNWAEVAHAALLSLNAGFSEELYFRLLLPLLLAILIGHAVPAFVLAALFFGFSHFYQGIVGILATTIIGLALTVVYLLSGSIWDAVALHALIDLFGLVIRPSLGLLFAPKRAAV